MFIEHNLDVIKLADWVIDLGPEAGDEGGRVVAMGRPEEVASVDASHTGQWLRTVLRPATRGRIQCRGGAGGGNAPLRAVARRARSPRRGAAAAAPAASGR